MMRIIRTGVMNNFNFTEREISELKKYEKTGKIFVNSNSFVSIKAEYPSIITINPYLFFVEPHGDISNVKACRIKICAGAYKWVKEQEKNAIEWSIKHGIPILATFQRWRKISTMDKFVPDEAKSIYYTYNKGWIRPNKAAKDLSRNIIINFVNEKFPKRTSNMINFCDFNGNGCEECRNCIKLTYPEHIDGLIYSLNLKESGDNGRCIFSCPDCFAKICLNLCKNHTPKCDVVYRNRKQKGLVSHE